MLLRIHPMRHNWRCKTRQPVLLTWQGHSVRRMCDNRAWHADSKLPRADSMFFQRRELCFTLDGDIFVRYQSFKVRMRWLPALLHSASTPQRQSAQPSSVPTALQDREELQRAMANKVPAKIDIGPVYNVDPQRRKAYTGRLHESATALLGRQKRAGR